MRLGVCIRTVSVAVSAASVVLLSPSAAAAQQASGGVKAGLALGDLPNIETAMDLTGTSSSHRVGFAAGAFAVMSGKSGLGFQPEVLYTQKGVTITATEAGVDAKMRVKIDYIDIPLLVRYTFGKGVRGFLVGGPSIDFKVSAKIKATVGSSSEEEDLSSSVETFEFAVAFGGGVEFGPILLEARWSEGLTNIDKGPTAGTTKVKTRTFLFLGGVRF